MYEKILSKKEKDLYFLLYFQTYSISIAMFNKQ